MIDAYQPQSAADLLRHYAAIGRRLGRDVKPTQLKVVPSSERVIAPSTAQILFPAPSDDAVNTIPDYCGQPTVVVDDRIASVLARLAEPRTPADHPEKPDVTITPPRRKSVDLIIAETAREHYVTAEDIRGENRARRFVIPRQRAIWRACHAWPHLSLAAIGNLFGGRDHTTILHAYRMVEAKLRELPADPDARNTAIADRITELVIYAGGAMTVDDAVAHFADPERARSRPLPRREK